jgi:hypothetical protein
MPKLGKKSLGFPLEWNIVLNGEGFSAQSLMSCVIGVAEIP